MARVHFIPCATPLHLILRVSRHRSQQTRSDGFLSIESISCGSPSEPSSFS